MIEGKIIPKKSQAGTDLFSLVMEYYACNANSIEQ